MAHGGGLHINKYLKWVGTFYKKYIIAKDNGQNLFKKINK